VRRRDADLIVSGFPSSRLPLQEVVSAGPQIEVIDLEDLRNAPREQMNWRHDSHLNPNGHRVVAELLLPRLEERLRGLIAGASANGGG
jgi:hypothetical protein